MKTEFYNYRGKRVTLKRICEEEKIRYPSLLNKILKGSFLAKALREAAKSKRGGRKPKHLIDGLTIKEYCKKNQISKNKVYYELYKKKK